jgi:hypothetical protein
MYFTVGSKVDTYTIYPIGDYVNAVVVYASGRYVIRKLLIFCKPADSYE